AREKLGEARGGCSDPVDRPERSGRKPEHQRDECRKERMIDFARQVHEQADEAEHPDVAGKGRAAAHAPVIAWGEATKQSTSAAAMNCFAPLAMTISWQCCALAN